MSLSAHYDPVSDRIIGVKEGTFLYYHEEGHRYWYKKGYESALQMWIGYFLLGAVALNSVDSPMGKYFVLACTLLLLVSEVQAWIFACRKWLKVKNDRKKGLEM